MDQLRAQLWNHMDWLESRGLTAGFSSTLARLAPQEKTDTASVQPTPTKWRLGFYSSSTLLTDEVTMVTRIAMALGLGTEDFHIWADDYSSAVPSELLRCPYIVALGPDSGRALLEPNHAVAMNLLQATPCGRPLLTIPHPRAMLQQPVLKSAAWAALQSLKNSGLS